MLPKYTVALDLSKHKHTATILETATTRPCTTVTVPVTAAGFQDFEATLQQYSTEPTDFVIGCEATGHYGETILRRLQRQGYPIVRMNPAQVAQFRRGLGRRAKTDAVDADAMAKQLSITAWTADVPIHESTRLLQRITRLRLMCVEEQARWINRARSLLNQICPELESVLGQIQAPTIMAVLTAYPSRLGLAQADRTALIQLVTTASRRRRGAAFAERIQRLAATSVGLDDPWLETELRYVLDHICRLQATIDDLERQIKQGVQQVLADYSTRLDRATPLTVADFPCGGYLALGTLLAELGDIQRFPSLKHMLGYLGWCPETNESGTWSNPHPPMSHRGNRYARRALWMLAIGVLRTVPEYRTYYTNRVAAGKNKMKTITAVARKLLGAIVAVLRTGQPYDPKRGHPDDRGIDAPTAAHTP